MSIRINSSGSSGGSIPGTITGGTNGSVLFIHPINTLAQDNSNFFYDSTNHRLGIGVGTSPAAALDIKTTDNLTSSLILRSHSFQVSHTFSIFDSTNSERVFFEDANNLFYANTFTSSFTTATHAESFGRGSSVSSNSTAFGYNAIANGGNDIAIGSGSQTGGGSIAIGASSIVSGAESVGIGYLLNISGNNTVAIVSNSFITPYAGTFINATGTVYADNGIMIGGAQSVDAFGISIGFQSQSGQYGIGMGYSTVAAASSIAIGNSIQASYSNSGAIGSSLTTQASDQFILGFQDTYFNNAITTNGSDVTLLHSADASSNDTPGANFTIQPGMARGLGTSGSFIISMTPSINLSGSSFGTPYNSLLMDQFGETALVGAPITLAVASSSNGIIAYQQSTTGYNTNGTSDYYNYMLYAYKTISGTKIFSTGVQIGAFTDDNSSITINSTSNGSSSITYGSGSYIANGNTIEYQIYARAIYNGNEIYNSTFTYTTTTDDSSTTPYTVNIAWTDADFSPYPGHTFAGVRILRQINGAGYNDYVDVTLGGSFNDDNTAWTSGNTVSPTTIKNFLQINFGWTAIGSPDGYVIQRSLGAGSFVATDAGNVTSFIDTGILSWSDPTTITPTSLTATRVDINTLGKALRINSAYNLPNSDGSAGYAVTTNGSGQWGYTILPTGTVTSIGISSSGSTLTIGSSPITGSGTITADINLSHSNTWTGQQIFNTTAPQVGTATASTPARFDASKNLVSGSFAVPQIVASTHSLANTATVSSVTAYTTPNDSTVHSFRVGAYTAITAISAGTLTITVTFTDENNNSQTATYFPMGLTSSGLTTTGFTPFESANIRCKPNTTITIVATFVGVSITYDVGGIIESIY